MARKVEPLDEDDLPELLKQELIDLGWFAETLDDAGALSLEELDGFLAGIVLTPEPIPVDEWLPAVCGGVTPGGWDETTIARVVERVVALYDAIKIDIEEGTFEPLLPLAEAGGTQAWLWAEAFMTAVSLRPEAWKPLLQSEDDVEMLVPIMGLCRDEEAHEWLSLTDADRKHLIANADQVIGDAVNEMAEYYGLAEPSAPAMPMVRSAPKIGRNDPCPCGSGKKYKKCCGA